MLSAPEVRLRPNVLAHPSPTTGRFLLVIATLLGVGLLVGTLVHNGVLKDRWTQGALGCSEQANAAVPIIIDPADAIEHNQVMSACLRPYEFTRAMFSIGGAGLIGLLGVAVVAFVPAVLRRRHRLRPAGPRLEAAANRIAELAAEAGVRQPPRLLLGPPAQRDAFVFGLPGRYGIVLPTALVVRWRQAELFDPVVRHELAHIRRRDVPFAWLTTAVWIAAVPVLVLPVVVAAVTRDLSLMPAYLLRAAIVLVILWLVQRQALRSREHDADLHAARQAGDWRPLTAVLETTKPAPAWWRRVVAHHPTVAQRLQILTDPGRVRGVSFVDALAGGVLTALLLPLIHSVVQVALTGPAVGWAPHVAAAIVGPITGLAVGVGLWRQAMIDRVTDRTTWPGVAVLGVVVGLLIGQFIDLSTVGLDRASGTATTLLVLMGAAGVLLSAGTGQLWADAAARLPGGPRSWWIGFTINALIFGVVLWAMQWVPVVLQAVGFGGYGPIDLIITLGRLVGPVFYVTIAPLVVTTAALVWRRTQRPTPQWLVEGPAPTWSRSAREPGLGWSLLAGVVPGLLAAAVVHSYRLVAGSPTTDDERINRYALWLATAALVAITVSLVTMIAVPRSGAAVGLVTGASAAVVAALGMLAANTFLIGNIFEWSFWWNTIIAVITLWLAGLLVLLPITLIVWPAPWTNVAGWLLAILTLVGSLIPVAVMAFIAFVWM